MKAEIPEISKQIHKEDVFNVLDKRYSILGPMWVSFQIEWFNGVYACFKDHDKFLIIIYLTKKTFDFYSTNLTKLTYDEFFSGKNIEIEKFNVSEISSALNIPKESARRKIVELEINGVIKRTKKKILIDRSCFDYVKPVKTIKKISTFLSVFSAMCFEEKILSKKITSEELALVIKNNFSHIWNFYYAMQIPMMTNYKIFFKDFETFHIFGTCVVNQHFHAKRLSDLYINRENFLHSTTLSDKVQGVNAMSISEVTGIPRATVIRKLKKLIKAKVLSIDEKKHYRVTKNSSNKTKPIQKNVLNSLANFSSKVFNLVMLQKKSAPKKFQSQESILEVQVKKYL
tara:strand:- start:40 stop:1068 length:1029 start_codon:yes stop_codon:yes gene_type:complete